MTADYVRWSACLHEIRAEDVVLQPMDVHGALYLYLTREVCIRIQMTPGRYEDPDKHPAELERDLAGLRQLADVAEEAAGQIEQLLQGGAR